jgi:hypothetical protein
VGVAVEVTVMIIGVLFEVVVGVITTTEVVGGGRVVVGMGGVKVEVLREEMVVGEVVVMRLVDVLVTITTEEVVSKVMVATRRQ